MKTRRVSFLDKSSIVTPAGRPPAKKVGSMEYQASLALLKPTSRLLFANSPPNPMGVEAKLHAKGDFTSMAVCEPSKSSI